MSVMAFDGVTSFLRWKDVTSTWKYIRHNPTFGGISSVQWRKVVRSWRVQMYFRRLLCVRIEIDQLYCVNCWLIIHCLSISCTRINHSCCALMIWSSLQLTSKQWFITVQFTARVGQFEPNIESWKIRNSKTRCLEIRLIVTVSMLYQFPSWCTADLRICFLYV